MFVGALALLLIAVTVVLGATFAPRRTNAPGQPADGALPTVDSPAGATEARPEPSAQGPSGAGGLGQSPATSASPGATPSGTPRGQSGPGFTVDPNQANCAAKPSRCGYPDATNTGVPAGTKLTVVNGTMNVTTAGSVIENKDIRGCVVIKAKNVTIRRSKISCSNFIGIYSYTENYSGGGLVVEDVEVDCLRSNGTGIGYYGLTVRRANVHGCENGFSLDKDSTVVDTYVHDLFEGNDAHADGIQTSGGGLTIRHNTIFVRGTSAIITHPTGSTNVTVTGNLLAGGAYTLYCPRDNGKSFQVVGNRFSTVLYEKGGAFGPWTDCQKASVSEGNVWDGSLQALQ